MFSNKTFLESLKQFDDIPFIVYHDYIKDKIFELKNTHPILLNSTFSREWYHHYKHFRQNFFFTENDMFLFKGYYDLVYSTFPILQTNDTPIGAFVYGGFRSKTSCDKILDLHDFPILDNHDLKKKCFKMYLHLSKHLKTKTLYFSIKHEIFNHLATNPTLEDISNILKISQRKIKNEISNQTNLTFSNFVSKIKLKYARYQLQYTEKSIHDISDSIGFLNTSSFIRFFKSKTSQTPLDYRKNTKK